MNWYYFNDWSVIKRKEGRKKNKKKFYFILAERDLSHLIKWHTQRFHNFISHGIFKLFMPEKGCLRDADLLSPAQPKPVA